MNEFTAAVRQRAGDRREYCRLPQPAFSRAFHIEHIVARQHLGFNSMGNLALACWNCNLKKGPNLSGVDPVTGEITLLFHPRTDTWEQPFSATPGTPIRPAIEIRGLTPTGRAKAHVLGFNEEMRQMLPYEPYLEGLYYTDPSGRVLSGRLTFAGATEPTHTPRRIDPSRDRRERVPTRSRP